ncbi:hypothetical protein C9I92_02990 [Photobacterium ganghwense]|uniref:Uncharacterized protein n=1 Tax=Photobacterium ganghwense TaxID=320778 RepID=A0A0J1K8R5_9GAMM|nr:hypothetical protein ABT57_04615 [Photobacterium ganghwense]PSU11091.1 hypothetical protein C9I92_02990 [Photobacterium ganghwense]
MKIVEPLQSVKSSIKTEKPIVNMSLTMGFFIKYTKTQRLNFKVVNKNEMTVWIIYSIDCSVRLLFRSAVKVLFE